MTGGSRRWVWWDAARAPQNRAPVTVALVVLGLAVAAIFGSRFLRDAWTGRWDAVLGITTVTLAVLIFVMGMSSRWTDSLPLRLTVDYQLVGKDGSTRPLMIAFDVPLAGVADIRGFSQQIASQMASRMGVPVPENRYVPFKPFNEIGQSQRVYDKEQGWFVRHRATFYVDFPGATNDLKQFWALCDSEHLRWGPAGRTSIEGSAPLSGRTGLLLWWNNLADRPSNDQAWVCGEHCENALEAIPDLSTVGVQLHLRRDEAGRLQLSDSREGAFTPVEETQGALDCGCWWDLTYSSSAVKKAQRGEASTS